MEFVLWLGCDNDTQKCLRQLNWHLKYPTVVNESINWLMSPIVQELLQENFLNNINSNYSLNIIMHINFIKGDTKFAVLLIYELLCLYFYSYKWQILSMKIQ